MSRMFSPLRYPGGKTAMLKLMGTVLRENNLYRRPYVEPFAGGCGLALGLLFSGDVSEIHINDVDPSIWSFWHSVLERADELTELVASADLTIEGWRDQRSIYLEGDQSDPLRLGFAAFYLNRTNRSGIIKGAGVIGGLKQEGTYKIDCRFNREDLVKRIKRVAKYRNRISLTQLDALDFLQYADQEISKQAMFCIDPPYFNKGSSLYTSFYRADDHSELSAMILNLDRPWIVTYDDTAEIRVLYRECAQFSFDVNYSVQTKRQATELLVSSAGLKMPTEVSPRKLVC